MKIVKRTLLSLLHAVVMTVMVLFLFRYPFLIDDEAKLNKWTLITRYYLFPDVGLNNRLLSKFVFVDVDGDLELADIPHGKGFQVVVTNRRHLGRMYHLLNEISKKSKINGIVSDILFEDHSQNDTALYSSIKALRVPTFYPSANKGKDSPDSKLIFDLKNTAVASYWPSDEKYFKYSYIDEDGTPTLPLLIYSTLHSLSVDPQLIFFGMEKHLYFTSFTTGLHLQNQDVKSKPATYFTLRELAERDSVAPLIPEMLTDLMKDRKFDNKIVLVG